MFVLKEQSVECVKHNQHIQKSCNCLCQPLLSMGCFPGMDCPAPKQSDGFCCCCCCFCLFFVFFRSPAISLGFTIFGEIFAYVTVFFNPTIKVVTFRLRGWCVLGVFFVAGIHPSRT